MSVPNNEDTHVKDYSNKEVAKMTKKLSFLLLISFLLLSAFGMLTPAILADNGVEEAEETVDITGKTIEQIAYDMELAINYVGSHNRGTVYVVGERDEYADSVLTLNVLENVVVKWEAVYPGNATGDLISLTGKGTFEVGESGKISQSGTGQAILVSADGKVIINGGEVKQVGTSGYAIRFNAGGGSL